MGNENTWGLLPEQVTAALRQREWDNTARLRDRLDGSRPFPIRFSLKPPTARQALADLDRFRRFVHAWRAWPHAGQIRWRSRNWRGLGNQELPVALEIGSMDELIALLGPRAEARSRHWQSLMQPLLDLEPRLSPALIRHLLTLEKMRPQDTRLLARLLPQLQPGMGRGRYLRGLPLEEVDTKFVETHQQLIGDCLDILHEGAVSAQEGLSQWLGCLETPKGWLLIRPLCPGARQRMAGLPLLQLDTATLLHHELPASRILVVENVQSGYALPALNDTIAVFGGGRNTKWMKAPWLQRKHLGYWGDIDTWGLAFLSDARSHQPHLDALMMDEATLRRHLPRMVEEKNPHEPLPPDLSDEEVRLFLSLRDGDFGKNRLEQERLAPDYVLECLNRWHGSF